MQHNIKYFLFDLGHVLVEYSGFDYLQKLYPDLAPDKLYPKWYTFKAVREFEVGRINASEFASKNGEVAVPWVKAKVTEKLTPIDELDANRKISPLISESDARKSGYFIHTNSHIPTAREDAQIIYRDYVKALLDQEKIKIGNHC